jgi:tetrapyrrole methylase family protein/MazG family protein
MHPERRKKITPEQIEALLNVVETVHRLRAPGGCSWDRAQTHQTLRPYVIEEAYEVLDVLDQIQGPESLQEPKTRAAFQEELGDLLMQVLLHSEMTSEVGAFDFFEVAKGLDEKLIRRHPHVFGDAKAETEQAALQNWEKQKAKEKAAQPQASVLDGLPKGLPALTKAARTIEKVTKVGFQWPTLEGPLAKIDEELGELRAEIEALQKAKTPEEQAALREKVSHELGDLLFTLANVGYLLKVNPEDSLRLTLTRFQSRFRHVETSLRALGKSPEQSTLEEMDRYWDEAKRLERNP